MRLLVVSDLYLGNLADATHGRARFPQLPALCELLRLGSRVGSASVHSFDWRAGLAMDLGATSLAGLAPGTVAAFAARGMEPGGAVCLAEPVHLVAGMASVHLHPAGLLDLEPMESAQLRDGFEREFGGPGQGLHRVGDRFLLESPLAAAAVAPDPASLLGSVLGAPRGQEAARDLRRLGVEVEMWLSGLALNRERERRGELPVSALWFWGGGGLPDGERGGAAPWEQAFGSDPWLHGCWKKLAGRDVLPATHWDEVAPTSAVVVASAVRSNARTTETAGLPLLESRWFEPALRDLRAGKMTSLALRIGGQRWDLGPRLGSRWWRRARPWWQVLAA